MQYKLPENKSSISNFDSVSVNPSSYKVKSIAKIANKEFKKDTYEVSNTRTGEVEIRDLDNGEVVFGGFTYKDNASFTKLFRGVEDEIPKLKTDSIKVLMYVIGELKSGKDVVSIDAVEVSKKLGYKNKRSVYDGILGLLCHEFLYRKTGLGGEYFVNINKIFRGSRSEVIIERDVKK